MTFSPTGRGLFARADTEHAWAFVTTVGGEQSQLSNKARKDAALARRVQNIRFAERTFAHGSCDSSQRTDDLICGHKCPPSEQHSGETHLRPSRHFKDHAGTCKEALAKGSVFSFMALCLVNGQQHFYIYEQGFQPISVGTLLQCPNQAKDKSFLSIRMPLSMSFKANFKPDKRDPSGTSRCTWGYTWPRSVPSPCKVSRTGTQHHNGTGLASPQLLPL